MPGRFDAWHARRAALSPIGQLPDVEAGEGRQGGFPPVLRGAAILDAERDVVAQGGHHHLVVGVLEHETNRAVHVHL